MFKFIKEELINSEIGHLPFLWPIAIMLLGIMKLVEKTESATLAILIILFLGFPSVIIWGISLLFLLPFTFIWWIILGITIDLKR